MPHCLETINSFDFIVRFMFNENMFETLFLSPRILSILCAAALSFSLTLRAQVWQGKPVDFSHGDLRVSDNKHFLQHRDGTPFFYLGDTAWELFHRLNHEEADLYLADRASKGFTVIQAVALSELDGISAPNAYGHLLLIDRDLSRLDIKEGADNDYWDNVDYIVNKANELGMYIGFLPSWGWYWRDKDPVMNIQNAEQYGEFLGKRYKDKQLIWILGGDRDVANDRQKEVIRALAAGLKKGDGGRHLFTFHPPGASGSSQWLHNEPWLDFNMRQNGHEILYTDRYSKTLDDYNLQPVKPVIDGEPVYEDHPVNFDAGRRGHTVSADLRPPFYWDTFNGALGHTYGHHSIWQMYDPDKKRSPINNPLMSWKEAIHQPGSTYMTYGRMLLESRPFLTRIPDPGLIVPDKVQTAVPGTGRYRFVAARDQDGTYAMIYAPAGRRFSVNLENIKAETIKAWWYDPRTGTASPIGTFKKSELPASFISPTPGETLDWILVLDNESKGYPPPGTRMNTK
ncbi:MAG: glycoside hydrolase family 140 protein [Verrucomicrobia bacterium]|nr:glycoside hydrolase family 140 protein [Verrucomicrobiota bacterium]